MAIITDIILLVIILFLSSYIVFSFFNMSLVAHILCSILATFVITSIIQRLFLKNKKGIISYRNFLTYLIWQGEDYAKSLLRLACKNQFDDKDEYIIVDGKIIFLWAKYASLSADTLIRYYRICLKNNIDKAYILTTNINKKSLSFVKRYCDVIILFDNFKWLYKQLKQDNLLPDIAHKKPSLKSYFNIIIHSAFNRKNAVRFVMVSFLLLAISFITPFGNYYISLASINLIFAFICIVNSLRK